MAKPLTRPDVEKLAASLRAVLDDADAGLSHDRRLRYEGALAAVEAILDRRSSLAPELDIHLL